MHNNDDLTGCVCAADNCKEGMCDGSGCLECEIKTDATETPYTLAGGDCYDCSDSNCLLCPAVAGTCTSCGSGYALVSGACQACSGGCDICLDSTTCRRCLSGYILSSSTMCT